MKNKSSITITSDEITSASKVLKLSKCLGRRIPEFENVVLKNENIAFKYYLAMFRAGEHWDELIDKWGSKFSLLRKIDYVQKSKTTIPKWEQLFWDFNGNMVGLHPAICYSYHTGRVPLYEDLFNKLTRTEENNLLLYNYFQYTTTGMSYQKIYTVIENWIKGDDLDFDVAYTRLALM